MCLVVKEGGRVTAFLHKKKMFPTETVSYIVIGMHATTTRIMHPTTSVYQIPRPCHVHGAFEHVINVAAG